MHHVYGFPHPPARRNPSIRHRGGYPLAVASPRTGERRRSAAELSPGWLSNERPSTVNRRPSRDALRSCDGARVPLPHSLPLPSFLTGDKTAYSLCQKCGHSPAMHPTAFFFSPPSISKLTTDGVLIKSCRNMTVSKQCSACQLSNCWALLQPLRLARPEEGRRRAKNADAHLAAGAKSAAAEGEAREGRAGWPRRRSRLRFATPAPLSPGQLGSASEIGHQLSKTSEEDGEDLLP